MEEITYIEILIFLDSSPSWLCMVFDSFYRYSLGSRRMRLHTAKSPLFGSKPNQLCRSSEGQEVLTTCSIKPCPQTLVETVSLHDCRFSFHACEDMSKGKYFGNVFEGYLRPDHRHLPSSKKNLNKLVKQNRITAPLQKVLMRTVLQCDPTSTR